MNPAEPLGFLLTGLAGRPMTVQMLPADARRGPRQRAILTATHLLLPDGLGHSPGQAGIETMQRAALAHAAAHLRHSPRAQPGKGLKPLGRAVASALEDVRAERLLAREFPGAARWFREAAAATRDDHVDGLDFASLVARALRLLRDPQAQDGNYWVGKARTLFEAQAERDLADAAAFRRIASVLANDLGQMRVRMEAATYAVPTPYADDNSYLWELEDPPPEQTPPHMLQGAPRGAGLEMSREESDAGGSRAQDEIVEQHVYPEWDYRQARLRPDWCTVQERRAYWPHAVPGGRVPRTALALRLQAEAWALSRAQRLRRQWEGEALDLNAVIEAALDRRLGRQPDGRLFQRPGRTPPCVEVLVLLDLSASANDPHGASGDTVLACEIEAARLLVRASRGQQGACVAVHGFCSDTRQAVHYHRLLEFDEPDSLPGMARLAGARAAYSTRLGAALRHASALLRQRPARRRVILVVTDGEPSDIDVFDSRYLVEDARRAVREARLAGLQVHCAGLDARAAAALRDIFGWRGYEIVDDAVRLPGRLARLYGRMAAGRR